MRLLLFTPKTDQYPQMPCSRPLDYCAKYTISSTILCLCSERLSNICTLNLNGIDLLSEVQSPNLTYQSVKQEQPVTKSILSFDSDYILVCTKVTYYNQIN